MSRLRIHDENHLVSRIGWLRAAVLGANDGIVSTASLIVGRGICCRPKRNPCCRHRRPCRCAGPRPAGEYVSVSSQSDTEQADIARETAELATQPEAELRELAGIYQKHGLEPALAMKVAKQLTAKDALAAHSREELGISQHTAANPIQAALTSARHLLWVRHCRL